MNYIRLAQLVGGLAIAAAFVAGAVRFVADWKHVHREAAAYADCQAWAANPVRTAGAGPLCAIKVRQAIQTAAMSEACDAGLRGGLKTTFAVQQACSAEVKRAVAERDVRAAEVANRDLEINNLMASRSADVARAETRGRDTGKRETRDAKIIAGAPRDPAGRVRCDAECLRALAE